MFYVNKPSIDYLTFTSFEQRVFTHWSKKLITFDEWVDDKNASRFENYAGVRVSREVGNIFMGEGIQRNKNHYLIEITSHLSELLFQEVSSFPGSGEFVDNRDSGEDEAPKFNCTRLDIQCTIPLPDKWSQWDLEVRLHDTGHMAWSVPSMTKGREYRTVYVGAKGSDHLIRFYEKPDDKGKLFLRFEVQYRNNKKGGYAWQAYKTVKREGEAGKAGILHNELLALNDAMLTDYFGVAIASKADNPIQLKREYTRAMSTRNWYIGQVLPSLAKYVEDNPHDAELYELFARVLFPVGEGFADGSFLD